MASGHGSRSCYVAGCRLPECRRAHTTYMREWKARTAPPPPDDTRHGSLNCYANYGCRCRPCTTANARKSQARRNVERQAS